MKIPRILIADDDSEIRKIAARSLKSQGFETFECCNGTDAYQTILKQRFDLILLDIDMEGLDGFSILTKIREQQISVPVLIITGNDEEYNEIYGFSIGADDYIVKPFRPSALSARVKAVLRRTQEAAQAKDTLTAGPFLLDKSNFTFYKNGIELSLTPKERLLMQLFMQHINHVFTKEQLYTSVWKDSYIDDNTIMVSIRNLRQKIEDNPRSPAFLLTVYGLGYKFVLPCNSTDGRRIV